MTAFIESFRRSCQPYPHANVLSAVNIALEELIVELRERTAMASILTAWILDEERAIEPPLLPTHLFDRILRELRLGAH